ncbi:hypothetical protein B0H13DRAFT_2075256 [Mycena leptocephala]|nr:hypothetical protein B0H13DRAFT_2075256 [Mycena leptocephala]
MLMGFARSLIVAIAVHHRRNDWKIALGWNQTVLPSLGTSVGTFTPPASAVKQNLASAELVSTLGVRGCAYLSVFLTSYLNTVEPMNECILLTAPWLNAISSFGPDPGSTCFGDSGDCNNGNAQWSFTFPGDDTGGWRRLTPSTTSFACVPPS